MGACKLLYCRFLPWQLSAELNLTWTSSPPCGQLGGIFWHLSGPHDLWHVQHDLVHSLRKKVKWRHTITVYLQVAKGFHHLILCNVHITYYEHYFQFATCTLQEDNQLKCVQKKALCTVLYCKIGFSHLSPSIHVRRTYYYVFLSCQKGEKDLSTSDFFAPMGEVCICRSILL